MNYKVFKDGEQVETRVCKIFPKPYNCEKQMEYVMFAVSGRSELVIESETEIKSAVIRPLSKKIPFKIESGKIFMTVERPVKLSVEINGSSENNLAVLTHDVKREEGPDNRGNCIVLKKGDEYTGTLTVTEDDTTVYIEDGAVLQGNIYAENCKNLTICGFGRICMERYTYEMRKDFARGVDIFNCKNVRIRDIVIDDSNDWSMRINGCEGVEIENVKIFGCRGNSDGIDVCGSRNVTVSDIFTRVWDDSFVVKALGTGNAENIVFRDSVLWNDFARPIEVGVELRADKVKNIRFENIDILHSTTGYPIMGIHHGDHARVSDIVFDNIRIEDAPGAQLFDVRIADSVWNRDGRMGDIRDVTFSDIKYLGTDDNGILLSESRLEGFSDEHDIQNVRFHNIEIGKKAVKSACELGLEVRGNVKNVSVTSDSPAEEAVSLSCNIDVQGDAVPEADGKYKAAVAVRLSNKTEKRISGTAAIAVAPKNTEAEREFKYDLYPGEERDFEFMFRLQPGRYIFFTKDREKSIKNAWTFAEFKVIIQEGTDINAAPRYEFVNYYGDREAAVRLGADGDCLVLQADNGADAVLYTAMPAERRDGEVVFSAEETDFGEVCAVIEKDGTLAAAPQLRCPAEITYVFKNEPKVKIIRTDIKLKKDTPIRLPLEKLGICGGEFLLELAVRTERTNSLRYPYTLFHSTAPDSTAHMFGRIKIIKEN